MESEWFLVYWTTLSHLHKLCGVEWEEQTSMHRFYSPVRGSPARHGAFWGTKWKTYFLYHHSNNINNGKMTSYYTIHPVRPHHFIQGLPLTPHSARQFYRAACIVWDAPRRLRCSKQQHKERTVRDTEAVRRRHNFFSPSKVKIVSVHALEAYSWSRRIALLNPKLHGRW